MGKIINRFKKFANESTYKIVLLILLYLLLSLLSTLPFTGLLIKGNVIIGILWVVIIIIFQLSSRVSLVIAFFSLVMATLAIQVGVNEYAQTFSEAAYLLFLVAIVQEIVLLFRRK